MPVKKETSNKKQVTRNKTTSLRAAAKQSQKKIATVRKSGPRNDKLSVPIYSLAGRAAGTMSLPKEVFGVRVNKSLLAQALRVYMTNQKNLPGSTKTRGEVRGSTAKIYRQKGTGRARHGAIRAPIFVGGGIAFGPKPRTVKLELSQKMRKAALISALSSKVSEKQAFGLIGIEKASGKTKELAKLVSLLFKLQASDKKAKSALIVTEEKMDNVVRATRNIPSVTTLPANIVNAYEVIKHDLLLLTKNAVDYLSGKSKAETVKR